MLDEDEADIEADIQRELDALGNDCLRLEDLEDETSTSPTRVQALHKIANTSLL